MNLNVLKNYKNADRLRLAARKVIAINNLARKTPNHQTVIEETPEDLLNQEEPNQM